MEYVVHDYNSTHLPFIVSTGKNCDACIIFSNLQYMMKAYV